MEYVWTILRRDLRTLFTPSNKKSLKTRVGIVLGVLLALGFAGGIGYGAYRLFTYLSSVLGFVPGFKVAIEINVLNGVCLALLVMVFLTGIQTTYKTIYESDDIGFLMAQPVPAKAIFSAKFATAYVTLLAMAGAFGLPAWWGYGIARGAGAGFYAVSTLVMCLLLLLAHSAVSFLLLVAMRYLPGRKMKQLFIASTAIFGLLIVLLSQILSAKIQTTNDPMEMLEMLGRGQLAKTWYLPSTWAVNAILGLLPEYGLRWLPFALALVIGSIGLAWLSIDISGKWFMAGWAGRTEETGAGVSKRKAARVRERTGTAPGGAFWTVLRKDLRLLFRDPLVWYNFAIGLIVVGFFAFNMRASGPAAQQMTGEGAGVLGAVVVMMAVMMGAVTSAQTGGISLSREGSSFWILRGCPVRAGELFAAKMTYALLPSVVLFVLSLLTVWMTGAPRFPVWKSIVMGGPMIVSVGSLQILLDVIFPDFTLKMEFGSSKSGRGTGKLLTTMFGSMGLVFGMFFLMAFPFTGLGAKVFPGVPTNTLAVAVQVAMLVIGAALAASTVHFGVKRLGKILTDM